VRIPLDYYRILGVPIKATDRELQQAYEDRSLQLPRREYSDKAIAARKQLLDKAYQVLSDPEQREAYDTRFLEASQAIASESESAASSSDSEQEQHPPEQIPISSTVEIAPELFIGALLIFQELGEYGLVIRLGTAYLDSTNLQEPSNSQDNQKEKEDIILTLALAYLELGREQWQQGKHENAAIAGQMGHNLLADNNLFPSIQDAIATDLSKLRPYRILELVAQGNLAAKNKGLQLLREMLQERQGIEGKGEDRSGLKFEHFLHFIQQLRRYLTTVEQQELFEAEAKRPSAVATYLAVYTLIARGFAEKQPQLIVRAQQMLESLSKRQDVNWERAICALLLGQTQQASEALQHSQEKEILELIRQYSQDSPDLLPGLCVYGEQWLHKEVLSQFPDLIDCQLTLKEYFADREVQAYLDRLSSLQLQQQHSLQTPAPPMTKAKTASPKRHNFFGWGKKPSQSQPVAKVAHYSSVSQKELVGAGVNHTAGGRNNSIGQTSSTGVRPQPHPSNGNFPAKGRQRQSPPRPERMHSQPPSRLARAGNRLKHHLRKPLRKKHSHSLFVKRGLLLIGLIVGVGSLGFVLTRSLLNRPTTLFSQQEQLAINLSDSPVRVIPTTNKPTEAVKEKVEAGVLSAAIAQQTIQKWLDSKAAAFGNQHQIDQLNTILTAPILSQWRTRAQDYKQSNAYRQYQHELKVRSATANQQNPSQAVVEAEVREVAQHYQGGQLDRSQSYDDKLLVRYDLVRQGEQWLIKNIAVVKQL
jgi:curved DNA-binding protein CbpA